MNRADRFYAMFPGTEHTRIDSVLRNFPDSVSDEQIASTLRLVLGIHDEAYEKMSYDHLGEGDETQGASTACSEYDEEAQATFLWMLEELLRVEERERAIQDEDEGYTREQIASLYADAQRSLSSGRGGVREFLKKVFRGEAVSACAQIIPGVHHIGGSATTSLSTGSNPDTRARSKPSNCVPPSCSGATTRNTFEVTQALRAAATDVATFHTSASGHCPPEPEPERCARLEQAVVQDASWGGALPAQEGPSTSQRFVEFSMGAQPMDFEGLMRQFQGGETSTLPNVGKVRSNTRTPNATFGTEEQLDPQKTADEFKAMLQGFY